MNAIKLYWCRGEGRSNHQRQNFGDYLSPILVEILSGRQVHHASVDRADMMAIGSILGRERKARRFGLPRRLHVWGTGTGVADTEFSNRHYYHAVRGRLTLGQIKGGAANVVLGDPGLLASLVLPPGVLHRQPRFRFGLIPHYADRDESIVKDLHNTLPGSRIIDVFSPVKEVVGEISRCDFILSSSLHGLIVADALGIPNQWLLLSRGRISEYKFSDYYTVFGLQNMFPACPETILRGECDFEIVRENYQRIGLQDVKDQLLRSFPVF